MRLEMRWYEKFPWERVMLGLAVVWGFVAVITVLLNQSVPGQNKEIVLSMVSVLGTALGAVVGAVFRQNQNDDQKNNTIATLAASASAPMVSTTTTEVTSGPASNPVKAQSGAATLGRGDEPASSGSASPIASPAASDFPIGPPSLGE